MFHNASMTDPLQDALIRQIDPRARDTILDVGCGAGDLAVSLKLDSPGTSVFGLDARPGLLDFAERKAYAADARVNFVYATFDDALDKLAAQSPTQIVCSRVLGHVTVRRRRALLAAMFNALPRGGVLHLAETGWLRLSGLWPRILSARSTAVSDGALALIRSAGFINCTVTGEVSTGTAPAALFRGVKP